MTKHESFDRMWEENRGLVYHAAQYMSRHTGVKPEELIGTLVLKFNQALEYYDPSRGKFSTLFWSHMRATLERDFLRFESDRRDLAYDLKRRDFAAWEETMRAYAYHEHGSKMYSVPEADKAWAESVIEEFPSWQEAWSFLSSGLHPREKDCIELYYLGKFTHREIAEHWGVTKQRSQQILDRALEKIRKKLAKFEEFRHLFA